MKKLRLTPNQWEEMLKDISFKYHDNYYQNVTNFEYTKTDVAEFLKQIEPKEIKKPIINITADAYIKMYELVNQSTVEIQWHGLVKRKDNIYTIYDILVFPQTNSAALTSSDQNEFAEWQTNLIMDMNFPINEMRLHGHSHVMMNVYSSAIDDGYQTELITKVDDGDFYIFLVLNKKMEMYPILYDFEQQILFEGHNEIMIEILDSNNQDIKTWCADQIAKYCKTETRKTYGYGQKYPTTNLKLEEDWDEPYISQILQKPRTIKRR